MRTEKLKKLHLRALGPIGALVIVLGILLDRNYIKGLGVGIGLIGVIMIVLMGRARPRDP